MSDLTASLVTSESERVGREVADEQCISLWTVIHGTPGDLAAH